MQCFSYVGVSLVTHSEATITLGDTGAAAKCTPVTPPQPLVCHINGFLDVYLHQSVDSWQDSVALFGPHYLMLAERCSVPFQGGFLKYQ